MEFSLHLGYGAPDLRLEVRISKMSLKLCLNWMGHWRKGPDDKPLSYYTSSDYLNGCHMIFEDVHPNSYTMQLLLEDIKKCTGVLGGVSLVVQYIGNRKNHVCVTTDKEVTKMLHFFEFLDEGIGNVYLSMSASEPVATYYFDEPLPSMYNVGSSSAPSTQVVDDDLEWLERGLPTKGHVDANEVEKLDANEVEELDENGTSEEDNWYDGMEVDAEVQSDGSGLQTDGGQSDEDQLDEDFMVAEDDEDADSDESVSDEDLGPQDGTDFLRFAEDYNDVFAGENDGPMNDDEVYTGERVELREGMEFNTIYHYRDHLRLHAIQNHYEYRCVKNEGARVTGVCMQDDCDWRCHASRLAHQPTFKVKTLNPVHTCPSRAQHCNRMARSSFVTHMITRKLREKNKDYSPKEIRVDIKLMFGIKISYHVAWYSRLLALEQIYGNYDQAYMDTPELCAQIISVHPRNKAKWSVTPGREFKSMFLCFYQSAECWRQNCRPVIGLDGCFLKGKYGGVCLAATGLDGNGGLFPIAIQICTGEDKESWKAFLRELKDILYKEEPLTFYSDRQKGLLQAVGEEFPFSNHRYCIRHIYANFEKFFKGKELKDLVYEAASAYTVGEYEEAMQKLMACNEDAYLYMMEIEPSCWARSHFDWTSCCMHTTNNMSESFNNMIRDMRDLPVTIFVEKFHQDLVHFINERRALSLQEEGPLTKRAMKDMKFKEMKSRMHTAEHISEHLLMVTSGTKRWEVNLFQRTCSCIEWQISGMPCVHAVVAIQERRLAIPMFYHKYFQLQSYAATYGENIRMIPDRSNWNRNNPTVVTPPPFKRQVGRPKTSRRRGPDEPEARGRAPRNKCSKCGQYGHNSRSCDGPQGGSRGRDVGSSSSRARGGGGATRGGGRATGAGTRGRGWRGAHRGRPEARGRGVALEEEQPYGGGVAATGDASSSHPRGKKKGKESRGRRGGGRATGGVRIEEPCSQYGSSSQPQAQPSQGGVGEAAGTQDQASQAQPSQDGVGAFAWLQWH